MKKILFALSMIIMIACSNNQIQEEAITKTVKKEKKTAHSFLITAIGAKEVFLEFSTGEKVKMGKSGKDKWFKNMLLKPSKIYYRYNIDGKIVLNESLPFQKETIEKEEFSYIVVKKENEFSIKNDTLEGQVDNISLKTKDHGDNYPFNVYLPPNYNAKNKYPLLFLMHGYGQDQNTWLINGIKEHMDNLIAKSYIKDFIIVMPLTDVSADLAGDFEPFRSSIYRELILDEVYSYVKNNYSVYEDREHHAISGFSMGGTMSIGFAVNNQDFFALSIPQAGWIPDALIQEFLNEDEKNGINLEISLYCGQQDSLYESNRHFSEILSKREINHKYNIYPGGHSGEFTVSIMREVLMEVSDFFYRY